MMQARSARALLSSAILASLLGAGCTQATEPPACVPSEADYEAVVRPLVLERCADCHGEAPAFGAPFSLLRYDRLVRGHEGERVVDRIAVRIPEGTMPPVGAPQPTVAERDLLASWASCGEVRVTEEGGLQVDRPPFGAPGAPPAGLETIDVTAMDHVVGSTVPEEYAELDFTDLVTEDVFIRRFEPVIDDARVLHHLTLRRGDPAMGDGGMEYLYAWAPGTGAFEFPEGGVRLSPGDNLRLQIHYNNRIGADDVSDSSGVRLYVGPVAGDEYGMVDPGPGAFGFAVGPRAAETVESECEVAEPVRALATMPHMHEIGRTFDLEVERGGEVEPLLSLTGWSFETQLFYELPVDLAAGDRLRVRCGFENPTDTEVRAGPRTSDEMCFAFTYVTPPPETLCRAGATGTSELVYAPGACVEEPLADVPVTLAGLSMESPTFEAGALPDGRFVSTRSLVVSPSTLASVVTVSFAGQMDVAAGALALDGALHFVAPTDALREGRQFDFSLAGDLTVPEGPARLDLSCPGPGEAPFDIGVVDGMPAVRYVVPDTPIELTIWMFFEAAP